MLRFKGFLQRVYAEYPTAVFGAVGWNKKQVRVPPPYLGFALTSAQGGHREHPHAPHAHEPRDVRLVPRVQPSKREREKKNTLIHFSQHPRKHENSRARAYIRTRTHSCAHNTKYAQRAPFRRHLSRFLNSTRPTAAAEMASRDGSGWIVRPVVIVVIWGTSDGPTCMKGEGEKKNKKAIHTEGSTRL